MFRAYSVLLAIIGVLAFLYGCTTVNLYDQKGSHREIYLPDGRKGYAIVCAGQYSTWGACLQTAGDLCKEKGYDAFLMDKSTGQFVSFFAAGNVALATNAPTATRELVVTCKGQ